MSSCARHKTVCIVLTQACCNWLDDDSEIKAGEPVLGSHYFVFAGLGSLFVKERLPHQIGKLHPIVVHQV